MPTSWSEVISNSALLLIDDERLNTLALTNPALLFRRMSFYVSQGITLLTRPPELFELLERGIVAPTFASGEWTSTQESLSGETSIETGEVGYQLACFTQQLNDQSGNAYVEPYGGATYDSETGTIVFPQQSAEGITYFWDLYTDGTFQADLTATQMRLLGLAIACIWDERFERNWLNIQMKLKDQNAETVNESNYMQASAARKTQNRAALDAELRKYEQDVAYRTAIPPSARRKSLF